MTPPAVGAAWRRAALGATLTAAAAGGLAAGAPGTGDGTASAATAPEPVVRGQLVIDGVPPVPAALKARLDAYQNARSARFRGWLGDTALIATRFGEVSQLHRVDAPLGMRRQLTFGAEPVWNAAVSPQPGASGFIFAKDVGGGEFHQLFWHDLATGSATLLTDGQSRHSGVVWAPSGCRFAYTTTERNGVDWDIHVRTLAPTEDDAPGSCRGVPTAERTVAVAGRGTGWSAAGFAPDGTRLLAIQYLSINASRLFEVDLETGALKRLLEGAGAVSIRDARYGAAGEDIFLSADFPGEYVNLHRRHGERGTLTNLTPSLPWDVEAFALSPDGGKLALVANEGGVGKLAVWRMPGMAPVPLPAIPPGLVQGLGFSADGKRLGFALNHALAPADVYAVDFETTTLVRWTASELGGLPSERLVAPERVSYESFDGLSIPAFLFRPHAGPPHPVLIDIHGGPEGQYRPAFSPTTQFFVNELGMAVVAPNVRGSSGYGKSWLKLDNGYRREDSVRDIGALLDWIAATEDLDAGRVAVMGGSYGGYMALAALAHFGGRLRAGIDRVGISNFVTFLETTEGYRQDLRRAEYGDERDPAMRAFLQRISPLNQVARISQPLLISQGLNDPRVPASESEQMVAALKRRGVPVWYVLARDEGHGFRKKANRDYQWAATALFLKRRVLD